jgi:hydrogenase maturation protease
MPATLVLSLGNVLMSDDGLGPAVLRAFEEQFSVGPDVAVMDLGTPGLDLSPWLADADRVVLIDTVKAALPPGSLRLYKKADLLGRAPDIRVSPHDPGVRETLLNLEFAGRCPRDIALVGVVPDVTTMGLELSPAVAAAVPAAVHAVVAALERFGVVVTRRTRVVSQGPWWSAAAANPA